MPNSFPPVPPPARACLLCCRAPGCRTQHASSSVNQACRLHLAQSARARRPVPSSSLQTAMRTEPLGLDRHCRRYWWLLSDPGFLFVEEPDGQRIGVISSKQQLDEVGT